VTEQDLRREPGRQLYDEHRTLIDEVTYGTARYHHLSSAVAGDFASYVWQRLLEANTLARFEGRCSIRTFLTVVIRNLFRDFRNHQWGKWRHSAAARRLGPLALRLEALTVRDGFSFEEALQMITADGRDVISRPALEDIGRQLPVRVRPRLVSEEALSDMPSPSAGADVAVERESQAGRARDVRAALSSALGSLPPQDALIIRLIFEDGFTVAQVASAIHLEQKALYRRRDQLLRTLRSRLQAAGITAAEVRDLIGALDEPESIAPGSAPMDTRAPITGEGP
jgi:RNA polymerase sigma factor (sigma-70 family)